jgi:hypothetical protein
MMAGMSGPQLAERVRLDDPAIAVVFDGIRVALLLVD